MPMAAGLLHPAVLLPEDAEAWPGEQRRAVLTHELGHVKRHDCLTQALAHAACALYWFHPLAWVAAWRLRVERERACDDLVLRAGASGPDYADQLLQLAREARDALRARLGARDGAALAARGPAARDPRSLARTTRPSRGLIAATAAAAGLLAVVLAGPGAVGGAGLGQHHAGVRHAGRRRARRRRRSQPTPQPAAAAARRNSARPRPSPSVTPAPDRRGAARAVGGVVAALSEAIRDSDAEVRGRP